MAVKLFESTGTPVTQVRLEIPLSFDEMVAALYYDAGLTNDELRKDTWVRAWVKTEVGVGGLVELWNHTQQLAEAEAAGEVENPDWLAFCRQRISEVFGPREQHASRAEVA